MKTPHECPACDAPLIINTLICKACDTQISGHFTLPPFFKMNHEEQAFIIDFFLSSGSLKEMAAQKNVSYPTMRNYLDDLIEKFKNLQNE